MAKGELSSLSRREAVLVDVLKGLAHIHTFGLVHRDIAPRNIMLAFDGTAKIGGERMMGKDSIFTAEYPSLT